MKVEQAGSIGFAIIVISLAWLNWVHDPRVRDDALTEVRIDSILEVQDSLLTRVDRWTGVVDSLEALSDSLRASLASRSQRGDPSQDRPGQPDLRHRRGSGGSFTWNT